MAQRLDGKDPLVEVAKPPAASPALEAVAPWPPRPAEVARWPIRWRERWGRRANELEDAGVPWPEHERQAFAEIKAEKEASPHG